MMTILIIATITALIYISSMSKYKKNYTNWPLSNIVWPKLCHVRWILAISILNTQQNSTSEHVKFNTTNSQLTEN